MRKLFLYIAALFFAVNANAQQWEGDAYPLHRAQCALTQVIVHDIFSPPVASRIYAYTSMAAYEVLAKNNHQYQSLFTLIKTFPQLPSSSYPIVPSLSAVYAYLLTAKSLVFSESAMQDSLNDILAWYKNKKIDSRLYNNSLQYGKQIADSLSVWINKDQYKETRKLRRYNFSKTEGKWIPTPPGYIAAVEPYWSRIRTLALDSGSQFLPLPAIAFGKDTASDFYQQAYAVYTAGNNLTNNQKLLASFWDCNPFNINTDGHLNFATKKISPGGHWMRITGEICGKTGADITKSAQAYTLVSIALFDAFISCWDEKYRSNVIRPETYINNYIDESWRPFLQTPPFPEYTSGHSVISSASAVILQHLFGNISFDDDTETEFGLPVRHFDSFTSASNEAAISRMYGGIHYLPSITNGQTEGKQIGEFVWNKIKLQ